MMKSWADNAGRTGFAFATFGGLSLLFGSTPSPLAMLTVGIILVFIGSVLTLISIAAKPQPHN